MKRPTSRRGGLGLFAVAGLVAVPVAWRVGARLAAPALPVVLEMQGPQGGLAELRWGEGPTDSIPLWPGHLIPGRHEIEISADPRGDPAQRGQVCVAGIAQSGGQPIPLASLGSGGTWSTVPDVGAACSRPGSAEPLALQEPSTTGLTLRLLKSPRSGRASVRWDGRAEILDLYSPNVVTTTISLEGVRRWHGRLPPDHPPKLWLQFRQGIVHGTLIRLQIQGATPQEWSDGRLSELMRPDPSIVSRPTARGLAFEVTRPEVAIRRPQPWIRSPRQLSPPQLLVLWCAATALLTLAGWPFRGISLAPVLRFGVLRLGLLAALNLAIGLVLLYAFERYLRWADPFLHELPFDSAYYYQNKTYYRYLETPENTIVFPWGGSSWYTWGHFVTYNSLGFRDRELVSPKPLDTCRVMVLGDSFTWGQGLAVEERYTDSAEARLKHAFPNRKIEVLSFALPSAPTTQERDSLRDHKEAVRPDLIVVGFVNNDPQPTGHVTPEEAFYHARWGRRLDAVSEHLVRTRLWETGKMARGAAYNLSVWGGLAPHWEVGLGTTYQRDSPEWTAFAQALRDIKRMSDEMGLPAPVFAVLNYTIDLDHATHIDDPDAELPARLRLCHQAERLARELGFRTYNHEKEMEGLRPEDVALNELDTHPSARMHAIYAQKLFESIGRDLRNAAICSPVR